MIEIYKKYHFGDMTAIYLHDKNTKLLGLTLLPTALEDKFCIKGRWNVESLVQVKAVGDPYPDGFSHGHTMRNSRTTRNLFFKEQLVEEKDNVTMVKTILQSDKLNVVHQLSYIEGEKTLTSVTKITNITESSLGIEMVSSYSVCGFSSLEEEERMGDFKLHRLRSKWSAEGKLDSARLLDLQLEPSWMRSGVQSVRYGEVGSMPVRKFFPWMVLEDEKYGYCIGSQLYHPASWQMEVYNRDDRIAFSGGIADREFGHWLKNLSSQETFLTPKAIITTCIGNVDEVSYRLTSAQKKNLTRVPEVEKNLPIVFNEFCTTWGSPSTENIKKIVGAVKGKGVKYCVIDAGWYAAKIGDWGNVGDWECNDTLFPGGLQDAVNAIQEGGMIPGIWFEFEIAGRGSKVFEKEDFLLKRDGIPIQTGNRRFLDMRKPEVIEYLAEKVIGILKKYNFGYLKVDYNDNLGIGCEGAESLGEGLRQNMEASQTFFRKIRREIPDIVIENCSSGGHRLEPSMQELVSMSSFSDAHECREIPIIAANVHRAILPAQSQIWAVFHKTDNEKRLYYSMANTLLGRMCLSGDIYDLSEKQWAIIDEGIRFYQECTPCIKEGKSEFYGLPITSYNHPVGWQGLVRSAENYNQTMIVVHTFKNAPDRIEIPLKGLMKIDRLYKREQVKVSIATDFLIIEAMEDYEGIGILLF
jgi:alpha-galactosidase